MTTAAARIESLQTDLADALESDDVATALVKLRAIRSLITTIPNAGGALSNFAYDRMALQQLERDLIRRKNAKAGVITQVPQRIVSPEMEDDYE